MGDVVQMLRAGGPPHGTRMVYAYVSYSQSAPTTFDDPLFVIIPSFSTEINFQCISWPQDHGGTLPAAGTDALVIFDDAPQRNCWCVGWAGSYSPPPYALTAG